MRGQGLRNLWIKIAGLSDPTFELRIRIKIFRNSFFTITTEVPEEKEVELNWKKSIIFHLP